MSRDCLVCANAFDETHIDCYGSCNHTGVCSLCYYRMRALSRDNRCPVCKKTLEHVICCDDPGVTFESFTIWGDSIGPDFDFDSKSSMFIPRAHYRNNISSLWKSQCTVCHVTKRDIPSLKKHAAADHNMQMCSLCIEHKHAFPSEHKIYTAAQFEKHLKKGDGDGGEGHPNCEFCRRRYYDKAGLFAHLTKDHYTCHICERHGNSYKYFENYDSLEKHFRGQHFLCEDKECLAKKFMVFSNEIDFSAHVKQYHPHSHSGRALPIHFKMDRPASETNLMDFSRAPRATRKDDFDAGMGGKARQGEWQVELGNIAPDPRAALREAELAPDPFTDAGPPSLEQSQEEYPSLPSSSSTRALTSAKKGSAMPVKQEKAPTGIGGMTPLGWIKVDKRLQDRKKGPTPANTKAAPVASIKFVESSASSTINTKAPAPKTVDFDLHEAIRASLEDAQRGKQATIADKLKQPETYMKATPRESAPISYDPPLSVNLSQTSQPKKVQKETPVVANTTWEAALKSMSSSAAPKVKKPQSHGISGVIRPSEPQALQRPRTAAIVPPGFTSALSDSTPPGFSSNSGNNSGGGLSATDIFKWTLKSDELAEGELPVPSDYSDAAIPRAAARLEDADFPSLPEYTPPLKATGAAQKMTATEVAKGAKKANPPKKSKAVSDIISMAFKK